MKEKIKVERVFAIDNEELEARLNEIDGRIISVERDYGEFYIETIIT